MNLYNYFFKKMIALITITIGGLAGVGLNIILKNINNELV